MAGRIALLHRALKNAKDDRTLFDRAQFSPGWGVHFWDISLHHNSDQVNTLTWSVHAVIFHVAVSSALVLQTIILTLIGMTLGLIDTLSTSLIFRFTTT